MWLHEHVKKAIDDTLCVAPMNAGFGDVLKEVLEEAPEEERIVSIDFETTSYNPRLPEDIVCCGIYLPGLYVFLYRDLIGAEELKNVLVSIFQVPNIEIVAHNAKFEIKVMRRILGIPFGILKKVKFKDTMALMHILIEDSSTYGLKDFARIFGLSDDYSTLIDFNDVAKSFSTNQAKSIIYNFLDCFLTYELYMIYRECVPRGTFDFLENELVNKLPFLLEELEHNGIKIDKEEIFNLILQREREKERILKKFNSLKSVKIAREYKLEQMKKKGKNVTELPPFNPNSNQDVHILFFKVLREKPLKHKLSADAAFLNKSKTVEAKLLLKYRQIEKELSTYLNPYSKFPHDRIHSTFHQTGTVSGRLSSSNPNLQNIPEELRRIFRSEDGYVFMEMDVQRAEALMFGVLSGDAETLSVLKSSDFHRWVASRIFRKPMSEISDKERQIAKTATFAILYGASASGLMEALTKHGVKIQLSTAEKIIDAYNKQLPIIEVFKRRICEFVEKNHFIDSLFGRRRNFSILKFINIDFDIAKQVYNFPVQSSLSDFFLSFLVFVLFNLPEEMLGTKLRIVNSVHDSVLFEVKQDALDEVFARLDELAKEFRKLLLKYEINIPIPFTLETKIGMVWSKDYMQNYKEIKI